MDRTRDIRPIFEGRILANQIGQFPSQLLSVVTPAYAFVGLSNVDELLALENAKQQRLNVVEISCEPPMRNCSIL
jgi:hypothetical protein